MRRCGHNPTDIEVADIINKIHDESGSVGFEVSAEVDSSELYKTMYKQRTNDVQMTYKRRTNDVQTTYKRRANGIQMT